MTPADFFEWVCVIGFAWLIFGLLAAGLAGLYLQWRDAIRGRK